MTESVGSFNDAIEKFEEVRQELEMGFTKSDCDAAKMIFDAMCTANLQYVDRANTISHLAWASLLYAQAVLRQHISAQATAQG